MKTAKEMFEELGYEVFEDYEPSLGTSIIVTKIKFEHEQSIIFNKDLKRIVFDIDTCIGIKELQAINKQVEELGWHQ